MNKFKIVIDGKFVQFFVDDKDLLDSLTEFEAPFAESIAGAYGYLTVKEIDKKLFLKPSGDRQILIFGCDCGIRECWPMEITIEVAEETITWTHFNQSFRPSWN